MLTLLRSVLDEASVKGLDSRMLQNADLSYEEAWADLDLEFGGDTDHGMRRRLAQTRLTHQGTVRLKDWRLYANSILEIQNLGTE